MSATEKKLLVYGAYGYTGKLICEYLNELGETYTIAGRDQTKTEIFAKELGVPFEVFSLDDVETTVKFLKEFAIVLHCAGPYSKTSKPMLDACIKAKTHYLDITGEYHVIEAIAARDAEVRAAGILAMPSTGMDVVPSDCLSAYVAGQLPSATDLKLYIKATGSASPGTSKTLLEEAGQPSKIRKDGKITRVPFGELTETITYPGGESVSMVSLPWGDIASAYHSTNIPNITVFMNIIPPLAAKVGYYMGPVLRAGITQYVLRCFVDKFVKGSDKDHRDSTGAEFIAVACDNEGNERKAYLRIKNGYTFTQLSAVAIALRVKNGDFKPGFFTPASLYGPDLVLSIDGSERKDL